MVEASLWSWAPATNVHAPTVGAQKSSHSGDTEGVGRLEEHHILICERVAPLEPGDPPYQTAVLDHDALGFSGGAGRVEDVGEVVRFWMARIRLMVRQHLEAA